MVISQRKNELESEIEKEPFNYDLWFDYCTLLEQQASVDIE